MGCSNSKNQDTHEPQISVKKTPKPKNLHKKQKSSLKKAKKSSIHPSQNQAETDGITQGKATTRANEIENRAELLVIQKQSSVVSLDGAPNRKKRISFCINGEVQELEKYQNLQNNANINIQKDDLKQHVQNINQSNHNEIQHKQQNSHDNKQINAECDQQKQIIELRQKSRSSSMLDGSVKDVKKLGNSISRKQKNSQGSSISYKKNNLSHKSSINNTDTQTIYYQGQVYHSLQPSIDQSNQNQHTKWQQQDNAEPIQNQQYQQFNKQRNQINQTISKDQQIMVNNNQFQQDHLMSNESLINNYKNHEIYSKNPEIENKITDQQQDNSIKQTNSLSRQNIIKPNIGKFQDDNHNMNIINQKLSHQNKDKQPTIVAQEYSIQSQKNCEQQKDFFVDKCPDLSRRESISTHKEDNVKQNDDPIQQQFLNLSEQKENSILDTTKNIKKNSNDTNKLRVEQQLQDSPIIQHSQQNQPFPTILNSIEESLKESSQQLLSEETLSLQNAQVNEAESMASSIELIPDNQQTNEKRSENKKKSVYIQKNQAAKLSQFFNKKNSLNDSSQSIDYNNDQHLKLPSQDQSQQCSIKKLEQTEIIQIGIDKYQNIKQLNDTNSSCLPESSTNIQNQYKIQQENKLLNEQKEEINKQEQNKLKKSSCTQINENLNEVQEIKQPHIFNNLNQDQKIMLDFKSKEGSQNGEDNTLQKQLDKLCLLNKTLKEVIEESATDSINTSFVQESNDDDSIYRERDINTGSNLVEVYQHLPTNLNIIEGQNSSKQLIGDNIQYFLSKLEELKIEQDKKDNMKKNNPIINDDDNIPPIKCFRNNSINPNDNEKLQEENNEKQQTKQINVDKNEQQQIQNIVNSYININQIYENDENNQQYNLTSLVMKNTQKFSNVQQTQAQSNEIDKKNQNVNIQASFDQIQSQLSLKTSQQQISKTHVTSIKQLNQQNSPLKEKQEFILDSSQSLNNNPSLKQSQNQNNVSKIASIKINEAQKQNKSAIKNISQNEIFIKRLSSFNQQEFIQIQNNFDLNTTGLDQDISIAFPDMIISINDQQIQQQINKMALDNNQIYNDKEFQPCESSLSENMKRFQRGNGLQWKRIKQFKQEYEKHSEIDIFGKNNQISVQDTVQGQLANCYFISSLTCIAQYPNLVYRLFNQMNCNPNKDLGNSSEVQQNYDINSAYSVNLCIDGEWQTTIIDDFLPFRKNDTDPKFCKFSDITKIFWTSLLEKTYAKFKGSYSNIEWGKNKNGSCDALIEFTGAPNKNFHFRNINKDEVWKTIYEGKKKGFLFTTIMKEEVEVSYMNQNQTQLDRSVNESGLISNHVYSILETQMLDNINILKLKNPLGITQWNRKWSDQCIQQLTDKLNESQKLETTDDGIFWMSFSDYYENFGSFCISYVHQDYFYSSISVQNEQENDKNIITYLIQPLDSESKGYFILYQNREHLEEYQKNQYVNHLVKINQMTEDGQNIVKQIASMYISTTKLAFTEINFEPNKVYKIVIVTERPSKLVLAFYTDSLIPLSKNQLQLNCSEEILIKQARLLAKKEKINTNYQVYWIQFICDQDHIVEISNETNNTIFSQSIQFDLTNLNIDSQLKDKESNTIKVLPSTTQRYIFKRIDQKKPVQFNYTKSDAEFINA